MILQKLKITIIKDNREKLNAVLISSKSEHRMIERERIIAHLEKVAEKLEISLKAARKQRKRFILKDFRDYWKTLFLMSI